MKYNLFKISVIIVASLSMVSCKKYLDINKDPNNATSVDPKLLFSFATSTLINNRAGGDLFYPMALGGQSQAGGGSSTEGVSWGTGGEDQYVFSPFSYGNIWTQYYTSVGINLKEAIRLAESAAPVNNNGAAQSKVILAEMFYELTTIYGDVPFSQALADSIGSPAFDSQQDVINGAIALIDEALAQFDPSSDIMIGDSYDMFYGDSESPIDEWIKAAKSLKLRMLMTMVDKDPTKASAIGDMINAGGFISSAADNMKIGFQDVAGKRNPKYQILADYNGGLDFFYASPYVLDPMTAVDDPRLPFFFDKASVWRASIDLPGGATDYHAIQPGDNADDAVDSKIAKTLHNPTEPEYLFTYQEQLFYEAEVYARGLGVTQDLTKANDLYKSAIAQSAISFGVAAGDANTFANGLPSLTSVSDPVAAIHLQQWLDKFDRGLDAFTQWRRSGPDGSEVPKLTLPVGAPAGGLFRRFEYPQNAELASNPNAPELVHFTEKMWFDL